MFRSNEDEARTGEVHEWMTAHRAESDDGPPIPCPHLDLVGTRRDMIANDPSTGGRFVALVGRLPRHVSTLFLDLSRPSFATETCHRAHSWRHADTSDGSVQVRWRTGQTAVGNRLGIHAWPTISHPMTDLTWM
jgi:hypothetical protein